MGQLIAKKMTKRTLFMHLSQSTEQNTKRSSRQNCITNKCVWDQKYYIVLLLMNRYDSHNNQITLKPCIVFANYKQVGNLSKIDNRKYLP